MELVRKVQVWVEGGLHARPAAEIVRLSKTFRSEIQLEAHEQVALARSSLNLLMLSVKEGDEVMLRARGDDAGPALDTLSAYLSGGRAAGAPSVATPPAATPVATPLPPADETGGGPRGIPVSAGLALGPVFVFRQPALNPVADTIAPGAVAAEQQRARAALAAVTVRIRSDAGAAAQGGDILLALAELAEDPEWEAEIMAAITLGRSADAALRDTAALRVAGLAALPDAYASARAEDMAAVGHMAALALQGKQPVSLAAAPPGAVVVADEVTAVHLGSTDLSRIAALVTARGAATGHAAIMARAQGIPAVFGLGGGIGVLLAAKRAAVDGDAGIVTADPGAEFTAGFTGRMAAAAAERADLQRYAGLRPQTADGVAITVAANIGSLADLDRAVAAGAMGVGLLRTEFLFMDRSQLPDEDEQYRIYRRILETFCDDVVIIRTLDIGGDKPARAIPVPAEDNPFLGLRGIRLSLARPDIFRVQLRALLRAAIHGHLHVMLPMVADLSEVRRTRALIDECCQDLLSEGMAFGRFALGIMVETPAAVFAAPALAAEVAFFSIGTNDLTQYVMAADRMNPAVAGLCRTANPAVLAAIGMVCDAARRAGIWVGVCGEAAADPALVPLLLRAGVRELSMSPGAILRVKRQVAGLDLTDFPPSATVT